MLAKNKNNNREHSDALLKRVNALPGYVQEHYINHGLIEGTKSKGIPTLGKFLEAYGKSWNTDASIKKRTFAYVLDYIPANTRLDAITKPIAEGILNFWANDRPKKGSRGGTLSPTTITKFLPRVKAAFEKAVEWYPGLKSSPFEGVDCKTIETNKDRHVSTCQFS